VEKAPVQRAGFLPVYFPFHFEGIKAVVTSRGFGDQKVKENRVRCCELIGIAPEELVLCEQVHGDKIHQVLAEEGGKLIPAADGLITGEAIPMGILTADCLPIFLYADLAEGFLGLIHAGWRGTLKGIARRAVRILKKMGIDQKRIYVAFGPAICSRCHEFDLTGKNVKALTDEGIPRENINSENLCTYENENLFSYKRQGKRSGRMMSVIYKESPARIISKGF